MIDARFEPLSTWPRTRTAAHKRVRGTFSIAYIKLLDSLERETNALKAKDIVIEAGFQREDIRNDGWPRSGARVPADPGVILSFGSKYGPLRLPCDHFKDWQSNLRAIALHLEHLRLASNYGVGEYGEQYKGWLRLEAGTPKEIEGMTVEEASATLAAIALKTTPEKLPKISSPEAWQVNNYLSILKRASMIAHPDMNGGDRSKWDELQRAKAVLDVFHQIKK